MRQAGLKPKSHNSGVYWVRASGKPGGHGEAKDDDTDESPLITPIALVLTLLAVVWYFVT